MKNERTLTAVAIDGPAASGKTTIGCLLADRLGILFVDTGCMYRAVTLAAIIQNAQIFNKAQIEAISKIIQIEILPAAQNNDGRLYTVLVDGNDVTWDLRRTEVDKNVSQVSSYKGVRKNLVHRQRAIAKGCDVVMVGRDIGTVVLPNAPIKLYIVASQEERAKRRWLEMKEQGRNNGYEEILADIIRRDEIDGNRLHSPMKPADDAILIDTTGRSQKQVLEEILLLEGLNDLLH